MRAERVEKIMASPSNLKELPQPIQKYYQQGINKDFYKLAQLQNSGEYMVGPIPCIGMFTEEKNNQIYKSLCINTKTISFKYLSFITCTRINFLFKRTHNISI